MAAFAFLSAMADDERLSLAANNIDLGAII